MAKAGVVGLEFRLDKLVAIEIDEPDVAMCEMVAKTRFLEEQLRIAMMAGAFSNSNGSGTKPQKSFRHSADQMSVSIHGSAGDVLHQVGLEQDGFPANVQIERPDSVINQLVEFVGVLVSWKNRDS